MNISALERWVLLAIAAVRKELLLTASFYIFVLSCLGFFADARLMEYFSISIADYAKIDDFLIAALKRPVFFVVFVLIGLAFVLVAAKLDKADVYRRFVEKGEKARTSAVDDWFASADAAGAGQRSARQARLRALQNGLIDAASFEERSVALAFISLILVVVILSWLCLRYQVSQDYQSAKDCNKDVKVVELLGGKKLGGDEGRVKQINVTSDFAFFFSCGRDAAVYTVPVSSVLSIRNVPDAE